MWENLWLMGSEKRWWRGQAWEVQMPRGCLQVMGY